MKIKYSLEIGAEEQAQIQQTIRDIAKRIERIAVLRITKKSRKGFIVLEEDSESEDEYSEDESEDNEESPPIPFALDGGKTEDEKPQAVPVDQVKIQQGKELFTNFVKMWLVNFDGEGPQPDRAEATRKLGITYDGPKVRAYVASVGGLTKAVREVIISDHSEDFDMIRKLAENITQVSSILFPQLTPFLEYPDPLTETQ
jgi:hypothetical protein